MGAAPQDGGAGVGALAARVDRVHGHGGADLLRRREAHRAAGTQGREGGRGTAQVTKEGGQCTLGGRREGRVWSMSRTRARADRESGLLCLCLNGGSGVCMEAAYPRFSIHAEPHGVPKVMSVFAVMGRMSQVAWQGRASAVRHRHSHRTHR